MADIPGCAMMHVIDLCNILTRFLRTHPRWIFTQSMQSPQQLPDTRLPDSTLHQQVVSKLAVHVLDVALIL